MGDIAYTFDELFIRRIIATIRTVEQQDPNTFAYGAPGQLGRFPARITAVSGSFPTWTYTVQRVTGYDSSLTSYNRWKTNSSNLTAMNNCEFAPPAGTYPYTYGTGNTITASDGTVNSTSCKIQPIGVGAVVDVTQHLAQSGAAVYRFFAPNSAQ